MKGGKMTMLKKKKKHLVQEPEGQLFSNLRMESADDRETKLNALIYGLSGVGKTRLLGSAQKCEDTSPIFFMAIDPGTVSISGSGIEVFRPTNFKEIQQAYNFLRFENTRFRSVGIDSVTEAHDRLAMGDILGVLQEDASYSNLDNHIPATQYDWLQSGEQMRRMIRAFRDLAYLPETEKRIHVLMTALERTDQKQSIICPALPGALGLSVGASIDILARLSLKKVEVAEGVFKRVRQLDMAEAEDEEGFKIICKARVPLNTSFPKDITKPTMSKLIAAWSSQPVAVEE